jgi:uncharacterized repeat protein (TIGR01451 family)
MKFTAEIYLLFLFLFFIASNKLYSQQCNLPSEAGNCGLLINGCLNVTGIPRANRDNFNNPSQVAGWSECWGTPQTLMTGVNGGVSATQWSIWSGAQQRVHGEGILTQLTTPLVPGRTYVLSYFVSLSTNIPAQNYFVRLANSATSGLPAGGGTIIPALPAEQQLIRHVTNFNNQNWEQVIVCFTANAAWDQLYIYPQQDPIPGQTFNGPQTWFNVDEVELIGTSLPNDTICLGRNITLSDPICPIFNTNITATYEWRAIGSNDILSTEESLTVTPTETTDYVVSKTLTIMGNINFPTEVIACNGNIVITDTIRVVAEPCLTISKSANRDFSYAGQHIAYFIEVCNGEDSAIEVRVEDVLPPLFSVITSTLPTEPVTLGPGCITYTVTGYYTDINLEPGFLNCAALLNPITNEILLNGLGDELTSCNTMPVYRGCPMNVSGTATGCQPGETVQLCLELHDFRADVTGFDFTFEFPDFLTYVGANDWVNLGLTGAIVTTDEVLGGLYVSVQCQPTNIGDVIQKLVCFDFTLNNNAPPEQNNYQIPVTNNITIIHSGSDFSEAYTQPEILYFPDTDPDNLCYPSIVNPNAMFIVQHECNTVTFVAEHTAPGAIHRWIFGDNKGTPLLGAGPTVSYTYDASGEYTVSHTIIIDGVASVTSQTVNVGQYDITDGLSLAANQTWNTNKKVKGNVNIPSGRTLTINNGAIIEFEVSSGITVEPGGKLIIDNASVKGRSDCGTMWNGITVLGNPGMAQPTNPNLQSNPHGFVHLKGGATISSSRIGINLSPAPSRYDAGGGMAWAENANFVNNHVAIYFEPYDYTNRSKVTNCNFECNSAMIDESDYQNGVDAFVILNGVKGIKITGSTFENTYPAPNFDKKGTAIRSSNSSYNVETGNKFIGLSKGIDAYSDGAVQYNVRVRNNEFINVRQGITTNGSSFDNISGNTFNIPKGEIVYYPVEAMEMFSLEPNSVLNPGAVVHATWGIYMFNTTGFVATENTLTSIASDQYTYGIVVKNSAAMGGKVYKNNFTNTFYVGTQAEQNNSKAEMKCNTYADAMLSDWAVTSGTLQNQGICTSDQSSPAGNIFHSSCSGTNQIYLSSSASVFSYRAHSNRVPTCTSSRVKVEICQSTANANSCPKLNLCTTPKCAADLEREIVKTPEMERDGLLADLIRIHLENNDHLSAIRVLERFNSLEANRILVPSFIAERDFRKSKEALAKIPADVQENIEYRKLFNVIIDMKEKKIKPEEMEPQQEAVVRDVAGQREVRTAVHAEATLVSSRKEMYVRMPEEIEFSDYSAARTGNENAESLNYSSKSVEDNFTTLSSSSISEGKNKFTVAPNPFKGTTYIQYELPEVTGNVEVSVFHLDGRLVKSFRLTENSGTIPVSDNLMNAGIYFIHFHSEGKSLATQKLVVLN